MNRSRLPPDPVRMVGAAAVAASTPKPKIKTSWHPITSCPRDITVQLMHKSGGVSTGVYHKFVEQVYTHWAPLPQSKDQEK